jgi:hypothetical protein
VGRGPARGSRVFIVLEELVPAFVVAAGLVLVLGMANTLDGAAATAAQPSPSPLCPAASPAREDPVDRLTPREARIAAPAAVIAPPKRTFDRLAWTAVEPSLTESGGSNALVVTGSLATGSLAMTPAGGLELDGVLCMIPEQTTSAETPATIVNGDAALHANSAPDTDTIVRPTASGVAVVESLRGADAPTTFSWKVGLPSGYSLRALANGSAAIVDSSRAAPVTQTPKAPAPAGWAKSMTDAATQLAQGRYEIARAERETGRKVLGVVSPPFAVDAKGNTSPVRLRNGGTQTLAVATPSDAEAVVLTLSILPSTSQVPKPPQPVNAYPLIAVPGDLSTEAANAACAFAQSQPRGQRLMLLSFGRAHTEAGQFGAGHRPFYSNADILAALSQAAASYRQDECHRKARRATIAYGVSNYKLSLTGNDGDPLSPQLAEATGAAQLQTALKLQQSENARDGVAVAGDLEPGWDPTRAGVKVAKALARGADSGPLTYYNFGTAGHCPPYSGRDPGCGAWRLRVLGNISQRRMAVPLPEIYYDYQAEQWARVRKRWDRHHARARRCSHDRTPKCYAFAGATSEPPACGADLSPSDSWNALWNANPAGSVASELIYWNPDQISC